MGKCLCFFFSPVAVVSSASAKLGAVVRAGPSSCSQGQGEAFSLIPECNLGSRLGRCPVSDRAVSSYSRFCDRWWFLWVCWDYTVLLLYSANMVNHTEGFFCWLLAEPTACGSSRARDRTHAAVATSASAPAAPEP